MTIKNIPYKALIAGIAISCSASAMAEISTFKVAVIKDTTASQEIISGDLEASITQLTLSNKNTFENNTGLCVAYLKSKNVEKSESACTAAIESISSVSSYDKKKTYLQSLSYSNRAIARYLKNDFTGAMDDLSVATSINSNTITAGNLQLLKNKILEVDESADSIFSE
ncbi:hypothetical protein [Colwellia sp. 20A7]|uniref:hypothetical protein n=1 Tax=Colwellia sp. 20A7 TaxID=2689569 RepID=UPI00135787EA|nr:hypothetical protein [Colwellia sp. 20A7]